MLIRKLLLSNFYKVLLEVEKKIMVTALKDFPQEAPGNVPSVNILAPSSDGICELLIICSFKELSQN